MLTTSDKAWVAGLAAWLGQIAAAKFGWTFLTPELVGGVVGVLTYWMPNKQTNDPPKA